MVLFIGMSDVPVTHFNSKEVGVDWNAYTL